MNHRQDVTRLFNPVCATHSRRRDIKTIYIYVYSTFGMDISFPSLSSTASHLFNIPYLLSINYCPGIEMPLTSAHVQSKISLPIAVHYLIHRSQVIVYDPNVRRSTTPGHNEYIKNFVPIYFS